MAIFVCALTLNLRLALDDTFTLGSELAYGSGGSGGQDGFWSQGESSRKTCIYSKVVTKVKYFKWYVNGEVVWSPTSPSASASGGTEYKEVEEEVITYGNEYKCDGIVDQCYVKFCYV